MANNTSTVGEFVVQQPRYRLIIVQVFVIAFFLINMLLIVTFFKKKSFHTTTRYLLFALMLLSDSFLLVMSDILLVLTAFEVVMQVWMCIIVSIAMFLFNMVTPITLTAMTLERYVAICMPLRHAELCSTRSTVHCILIIHGISSIPCIVILSMFFASVSLSIFKQNMVCSTEIFLLYKWHHDLRSAVSQSFFLIMCIVIVFSYYKIMRVAKAASGENKKSTLKGLKTVILHGFQLLLCLIQLWCSFIETASLQVSISFFISVRYANYIVFTLAPRCLSPLIYGLRDETFFLALKKLWVS
ncbi:odorant receptor 131-2-like [Oryzias melastigma]|uniref:odorant receptor 131-2-like n=1 Tax=Oryzias melastigma TaxID=30732 RepID=UPI000CF83025|nr:odorant receptor 131-2-like [Oryzias melastigma]